MVKAAVRNGSSVAAVERRICGRNCQRRSALGLLVEDVGWWAMNDSRAEEKAKLPSGRAESERINQA